MNRRAKKPSWWILMYGWWPYIILLVSVGVYAAAAFWLGPDKPRDLATVCVEVCGDRVLEATSTTCRCAEVPK